MKRKSFYTPFALKEFEAISERGGVLGAMETGDQRGKI